MSDSLSWIDDADSERIEGLVRRSAEVIAAARRDLEEQHVTAHNRLPADLPKRELPSPPATQRQVTSAQRRARLRQLLRNPNPDNVATPAHQTGRNLRVDPTNAEQIEERSTRVRLQRQPADARFQPEENEELQKRDDQRHRRRRRRNKEAAPPKSVSNDFPSKLVSYPQRLDYLTNVVIGVLATALVISLFVHAGQSNSYSDALPLMADAKTGSSHRASHLESSASLPIAQGFDIVPRAFPEPLPAFAKDISGLLFLADPLPASAPGISILPYAGLPRALPAFPEDVARLIGIASPERKTPEL